MKLFDPLIVCNIIKRLHFTMHRWDYFVICNILLKNIDRKLADYETLPLMDER